MLGLDFQKTKQHTKFSETSRTRIDIFCFPNFLNGLQKIAVNAAKSWVIWQTSAELHLSGEEKK